MIYNSNADFKALIRDFIKSKGISQSFIAKKLNVPSQKINRLTQDYGKSKLSIDNAKEILNAIGYDIDIQIVPHYEDDNA